MKPNKLEFVPLWLVDFLFRASDHAARLLMFTHRGAGLPRPGTKEWVALAALSMLLFGLHWVRRTGGAVPIETLVVGCVLVLALLASELGREQPGLSAGFFLLSLAPDLIGFTLALGAAPAGMHVPLDLWRAAALAVLTWRLSWRTPVVALPRNNDNEQGEQP